MLVLGGAEHNTVSSPPLEDEQEQLVLLAADAHGAVVATATEVRGIDRSGSVQWSIDDWPPLYGACAPECPSAVLSGDARNLNSFMAPDPEPVLIGGGSAPAWLREATHGKAAVLAAQSGGLMYATDDSGEAFWRTGTQTLKGPEISPGFLNWFPASDDSAGVAVIDGGEYRQTAWFATAAGGWRARPEIGRSSSGFGCVSSGARLWVTDARHIARVKQPPVEIAADSEEPALSACGFTARSLITVLHRASAKGATTTVRVIDVNTGQARHTRTLEGEYLLSTDVASGRFLLAGMRELRLYGPSGALLRTVPEVVTARFVGNGEIVVVRPDGQVEWRW